MFAALAEDGAEGVVVSDEEDNVTNLKSIIELAEKNPLPTIYPFAFFVEDWRIDVVRDQHSGFWPQHELSPNLGDERGQAAAA